MYKKNVFLFFMMALTFLACKPKEKKEPSSIAKPKQTSIKKEIKSKDLTPKPTDAFVEGNYSGEWKNDFKNKKSELIIYYGDKEIFRKKYDHIIAYYMVDDLDKNGDKEIYFVTKDNENADLFAFNLSGEFVSEIYRERLPKDFIIANYKIGDGQLWEIYIDPKIKKPAIRKYNLIAGEAAWSLKPEGYPRNQLQAMTGTFVKGKNTLTVAPNEYGEWVVTLGHGGCKNILMGAFIDGVCYAPLNYLDPRLKGKLLISFNKERAEIKLKEDTYKGDFGHLCNEDVLGIYHR